IPFQPAIPDMRKWVRDKWTMIKPYLPPQVSTKSFQTMNPIQSITDPTSHLGAPVNKMKIKVVTDLFAAIPPLIDLDPEQILKFLIQVNQNFRNAVISAAKILGTEVQLVHRIVQNLHPKIKSHCVFQNRPESIASLFSLATRVAEAVAVEDQRQLTTGSFLRGGDPRPFVNATVQTKGSPAKTELKNACWACGKTGHFQRTCPSKTHPTSRAGRSGNAGGARQ
ncbi:hypothetical protein B7P43_G18392, partial [Cryptotermes secundus]